MQIETYTILDWIDIDKLNWNCLSEISSLLLGCTLRRRVTRILDIRLQRLEKLGWLPLVVGDSQCYRHVEELRKFAPNNRISTGPSFRGAFNSAHVTIDFLSNVSHHYKKLLCDNCLLSQPNHVDGLGGVPVQILWKSLAPLARKLSLNLGNIFEQRRPVKDQNDVQI